MAATQTIYCIPPVTADSVVPPSLGSAKGRTRKDCQPKATAIVQINMDDNTANLSRQSTRSSTGFHPSSPSRHKRLTSNSTQKSLSRPTNQLSVDKKNTRNKSTSKEYMPTLPKHCFTASTYESVLTDSSSYCEDISRLPPPRHTLMTREVPYVFRYKIQKANSSLRSMIPNKSKRQPDHIW